MTRDPHEGPPLFRHVDFEESDGDEDSSADVNSAEDSLFVLLERLVEAQERQNDLIEELVEEVGAAHRQRQEELGQWKQANPRLARRCHRAAEVLGRVQQKFLEDLTNDIHESAEELLESDYVLSEFVERYGPRLTHLSGLLQMLAQRSSRSSPTE